MHIYQITYDLGGDILTATIEATGPVAAARIFLEQNPEGNPVVLCVVRQ